MTINDCDVKMGSNVETMGDDDTIESRHYGVCEIRLDMRFFYVGWTVDPRERRPNCEMCDSMRKQMHNEVNHEINETKPGLLVVRMTAAAQ